MCDDHSPFYSRSEPVARFVHRCAECYFPIQRGERHVATALKDDGGSVDTWRAHVLCDMLAQRISVEDGCRMHGELLEAAHEVDLTPLQARWFESLTGFKVDREADGR